MSQAFIFLNYKDICVTFMSTALWFSLQWNAQRSRFLWFSDVSYKTTLTAIVFCTTRWSHSPWFSAWSLDSNMLMNKRTQRCWSSTFMIITFSPEQRPKTGNWFGWLVCSSMFDVCVNPFFFLFHLSTEFPRLDVHQSTRSTQLICFCVLVLIGSG